MITTLLTGRPAVTLLARLRAWPVESQQRARRNAMLAATDCAQRRAERQEVADYLDHGDATRPSLPRAADG